MSYSLLLQYLLCMNPDINLGFDVQTEHAVGFDSQSSMRAGNRVCHQELLDDQDIMQIKKHFNHEPFAWFVDALDQTSIEKLQQHNMTYRCCFAAAMCDLESLPTVPFHADIVIQEITDHALIETVWTSCVVQAFQPTQPVFTQAGMNAVINNLLLKNSPNVHFYLGFYQNQVASACMAIHHNSIVSLHWVGTLPEFCYKGLGLAITQQALWNAKVVGCTQAILIMTSSGKKIYDRLGFKDYALYQIYGN